MCGDYFTFLFNNQEEKMSDLPKDHKPFKVSLEDYEEMLRYFEMIRDEADKSNSNYKDLVFPSSINSALPVGLLHLNCYNVCVLIRYMLENYDKIGTQAVKSETEKPFIILTNGEEQLGCIRKSGIDAVTRSKDGLGGIVTKIVVGGSTLTLEGDSFDEIALGIGA